MPFTRSILEKLRETSDRTKHTRITAKKTDSTMISAADSTHRAITNSNESGGLVIGSARWRTIEEASRNIPAHWQSFDRIATARPIGGSMRCPRFSSFIAYSRIPPAVLLRFSRHLAPTLALNLPLTASTDSRSARGIRTIRFFVDPRQTRCENIATKERNRKHGFAKNMK